MSLAKYDILIIGGGAIGLSLARELARSGKGRIAVVERGRVGREASYAAAGMLAPNSENLVIDDFYRLCDASRQMYPDLAAELLAETGLDIELDRTGTIFAAFTEEDEAALDLRFSRQIEAGIKVERLTGSDTLKAEPAISDRVRSSLLFESDWQVENRKLMGAFAGYAAKHDEISILEDTEVVSLIARDKAVHGVRTSRGEIHAGVTVLATGAWTSLIKIDTAPMPLRVKPIRGQIICYQPPERIFRHVIHSPRGYLVPRADGRILVGGASDDVGFESNCTPDTEKALKDTACEFAPALAGLPVSDAWAGLRPFVTGGLPVIGEMPGHERLFVATGHYRNGILLAPVTARLLAHRIIYGVHEPQFEALAAEFEPRIEGNASA